MPTRYSLDINSASPEKRLLVHCARSSLRLADMEAIRDLVQQPLDWHYILADAAENSVTPLLNRSLQQAASNLVPDAIFDQLKEAYRANTIRCMYLSTELVRVLGLFRSAAIRAIPFKGPILACQAYGDLTLREFEDLDIVLSQADLPRAHELMESQGYRARYPWILSRGAVSTLVPGEYNYRDKSRRVMVELHTELTLRHFPRVPDLEALATPPSFVHLATTDVESFSPEVTLVLLCLHGSKDFWERLSWVADLSEVIRSHPALDWTEVHRRAESVRAVRILYLGLRLAMELFEAEIPPDVCRRVEGDSSVNDLAGGVINRLLSRKLPHLNTFRRFQFRRKLLNGLLTGTRYSLRLTLVPTEEDWEMIPLQGILSSLYIFLRPLRLIRKYGLRARAAETISSSGSRSER
jgi:hypothetical protein